MSGSGARKRARQAGQSSACGGRGGYHHGNLRAALVAAGLEILEREGIDGLSLRSTARAAGVSQTAPYHHFGCKEGLFAAMATEGLRRMADSMQHPDIQNVDCSEEPDAKVRALGANYVRWARSNPELFKLIFGPLIQNREPYPELVAAYEAGYSSIEEATAEMLERLGADAEHLKLAVTSAWAMVHGLSLLLIDRKVVPGERGQPDEQTLVDTVLRALDWKTAEKSLRR